ncbi:MAG: helicase-related protein [Candidatus Woesearchaeota archaeon]
MPEVEKVKIIYEAAVINLAFDTINRKKQALVFVNTKRSAEKTAEEIAKNIRGVNVEHREIADRALAALASPTHQCKRLSYCLEKGIAFHHAGLTSKQKEIIEENFKKGIVRVICCTPTLAAGLDLPAFRTIIRDVKRYGYRGLSYIPVLEYLQMAGRAGRPKYDKFGESIIVANSEPDAEKVTEKYIYGEPEEIYSKLAVEPVLRTYLLSLVASRFVESKEQIMDFFEKTFWAYQFQDMERIELIINKMLDLLEEWEFIMKNSADKDFVDADELDKESYSATTLGKRVSELYIDPYTAHYMMESLRKHTGRNVKPFSFMQLISHTLEMRPLLNVKSSEIEDIEEKLVFYQDQILDEEPSMYDPEYDDYLKSIKTALFFNDWADEKSEEIILETYNVRPGETRTKLDIANWLLYTTEELARIMQFQKLIKDIMKVRLRLRYGVKEELLPLLRLKNIGRVRARKLFNNKIIDIKSVRTADIKKLELILGKKIARDVKKQVGENIPVVDKEKASSTLKDY